MIKAWLFLKTIILKSHFILVCSRCNFSRFFCNELILEDYWWKISFIIFFVEISCVSRVSSFWNDKLWSIFYQKYWWKLMWFWHFCWKISLKNLEHFDESLSKTLLKNVRHLSISINISISIFQQNFSSKFNIPSTF